MVLVNGVRVAAIACTCACSVMFVNLRRFECFIVCTVAVLLDFLRLNKRRRRHRLWRLPPPPPPPPPPSCYLLLHLLNTWFDLVKALSESLSVLKSVRATICENFRDRKIAACNNDF